MWNLKDNNGNKVQNNAVVTFDVRDFDDTKKTVTGVIDRIFKRQCEVVYFNWKGEIAYIKVATRKLTIVKYPDPDESISYSDLLNSIKGKNSFYKVW